MSTELENAIQSISTAADRTTKTTTFVDQLSTYDDISDVTNPNTGETVPSLQKKTRLVAEAAFAESETKINQAVSDAELAALAAQSAANYDTEFVVGVTSAIKGKSYLYDGSLWACLNDTTETPTIGNVNWYSLANHNSLTNRDDSDSHPASSVTGVKEMRDELVGGVVYPFDPEKELQVGDVVPVGTTHLRVSSGVFPVSIDANGEVTAITNTTATIGGIEVVFLGLIQMPNGALSTCAFANGELDITNCKRFAENDTQAFNDAMSYAIAHNEFIKKVTASGVWYIPHPERSPSGYSGYMTWNYSHLIDGFKGEIDLSKSKFVLKEKTSASVRVTLFVMLRCEGMFKCPEVDGNLSNQLLGSSYIDDCVVRVGGGCNNLTIIQNNEIKDWPGHGVITRHYMQDGYASLSEGVPTNIHFGGSGLMSGMWQSGFVPITGYGIYCLFKKIVGSGNNNTFNNQQSTTGHNFHQEAVTDGANNPYIGDVYFYECEAEQARQHGFMIHTAINNTKIIGGTSRLNGENGARYEGYCQSLDVDGLIVEDNVSHGEFVSLSTATWQGSETKDVAATIRTIRRRNGGDGVRDNSGGASLMIKGYTGYNNGNGIIMATAALPSVRQFISDMVVANNGMGTGAEYYGILAQSAIMDNVRVINQDPVKYKQTPFLFNGNQPTMTAVTVDGNSNTGYDFSCSSVSNLPIGSKGVTLYGDLANIINDRLIINPLPTGNHNLPSGYKYYRVDRQDGQYPTYRVDSSTSRNVGLETVIDYVGGANNIELRTKGGEGTINGESQPFLMQANTKYRLDYEDGNISATAI